MQSSDYYTDDDEEIAKAKEYLRQQVPVLFLTVGRFLGPKVLGSLLFLFGFRFHTRPF